MVMSKTAVLLCYSNSAIARDFLGALPISNDKRISLLPEGIVDSFYDSCENSISVDERFLFEKNFNKWSGLIDIFFQNQLFGPIDKFVNSPRNFLIIPSTRNANFINNWRIFCASRDINARIVHIRDFSGLHGNISSFSHDEFSCAVHVALQNDTDVFCFEIDDLKRFHDEREVLKSLVLGTPFSFSSNVFALDSAPRPQSAPLPLECRLVEDLFTGARGGSHLSLKDPGNLDELKFAARKHSSLACLLEQAKEGTLIQARAERCSCEQEAYALREAFSEILANYKELKKRVASALAEMDTSPKNSTKLAFVEAILSGKPIPSEQTAPAIQRALVPLTPFSLTRARFFSNLRKLRDPKKVKNYAKKQIGRVINRLKKFFS